MKVDFILTGDLHIRDDQPEARTDNYFEAQTKKIKFLKEQQEKYKCPILCAGDLFHKARSSKELEVWCLNNLPDNIITVPGNHDLPNHNLNKLDDSSLGVLNAADKILVHGVPLDTFTTIDYEDKKIGMIHSLIYHTDPIIAEGKIISKSAEKILKEHLEFDIILSGDNHQTFVVEYKGRILINVGSMMRMNAGQIEHKPCLYLLCTADNSVVQVFYPIKQGVISRDHIEAKTGVSERFDSFINRMNSDYEMSLSFEKNVEAYFKANKTRKPVQEEVWNHIN